MSRPDHLTESEIDAIFEAEREGRLPSAAVRRRRTRRITTVDFSRPSTFTKDQERRLRRALEAFCRTTSTALSGESHATVDLEVLSVAQAAWSAALQETGSDSLFGLIELRGLGTRMAMTLDRMFVVSIIDRLCGGNDRMPASDRRMTEIDLVLARRVFGLLVEQLALVWQDAVGVDLALQELEMDSSGAQIASPAEPTLVTIVEVWVDSTSYVLRILLPHASVDAATGAFAEDDDAVATASPGNARARMQRALGDIEVEVRATVAALEVTPEQLLELRVGDVIPLGPAGPVTLSAGERPLHSARPGSQGSRRAVQVVADRRSW